MHREHVLVANFVITSHAPLDNKNYCGHCHAFDYQSYSHDFFSVTSDYSCLVNLSSSPYLFFLSRAFFFHGPLFFHEPFSFMGLSPFTSLFSTLPLPFYI